MTEANELTTQTGNGHTIAPAEGTTGISEKSKAVITEAVEGLASIKDAHKEALALKTKIEDHQTVIATKSEHIENARKHGDEVISELDRQLTTAKTQATEAETHKTRAQTAADTVTKLAGDVKAAVSTAETDGNAISGILTAAKESAAKTNALANKAESVQQILTNYEKRLAELNEQGKVRLAQFEEEGATWLASSDKRAQTMLKTIESLLPGAASAGLSSSFGDRRQSFAAPQKKWEAWFIGSVVSIFVLALIGFIQLHLMEKLTAEDVLIYWLMRAPLAVPLVWLALHASREVALAKRLEEDYGYKVAMSACFEGFRKQMSEIGTDVGSEHPLGKLCADTLKTIADPPGRIYAKEKLTTTPADQMTEIAKAVKEAIENRISGKSE